MLVLSRKRNESIMIGDEIEIKIVAVEGDTVRLGIEAPRHVSVYRKEVYLSIQSANREAATRSAPDSDELARLSRIAHEGENR